MRIKTVSIALFLSIALAYVGLKGVIYYKVKRQVDTIVSAATLFAEIQYGAISSTLGGNVRIDNVSVSPRGTTDFVSIEHINIITPGLNYLLNGSNSMRKGEMPERLGLNIQGALVRLEGSLVNLLEKAESEQTKKQPVVGAVCTLSHAFITAQFRELGIKELVTDWNLIMERGSEATEIKIDVQVQLRDIEKYSVAMILEGFGNSLSQVSVAVPRFKQLKLSYTPDPKFIANRLQYCSQREGVDSSEFIDRLYNADDDYFANAIGIIPGPGIREGLKKLAQGPGGLQITANPLTPIDISTLSLYKPEDLPNLFGLSAAVGDMTITDFSFRFPKDTSKESQSRSSLLGLPSIFGKAAEKDQKLKGERNTKSSPSKRSEKAIDSRYRVVSVKELSALVGKDVKIITTGGMRRSGQIIGMDNQVVSLEKRTRGGTFSTQVLLEQIQKIEVAVD